MKHRAAMNVLKSWLNASGISTLDNEGAVCFDGPNGFTKVVFSSDEEGIYVSPEDIVNRNPKKSVATFNELMEKCGIKDHKPVFRGNEEDLGVRVRVEDGDADLRIMRHQEFRLAADIPSSVIESMSSCISTVARMYYRHNTKTLVRLSIGLEDLEQYARVWTVNFMHRYRRESQEETKKLLVNYLKQRFHELHDVLKRSEPSYTPTASTLEASAYSDCVVACDGNGEYEWVVYPREYAEEKEQEESPAMQKSVARQKLLKAIESLPREEAVQKLTEASENEFLAPDAQALAKSLLKRYKTAA